VAFKAPTRELLAVPVVRSAINLLVQRAIQSFQPGQVLTSWWRDPDENADVGGSPDSQHLFGLALDVTGPGLAATQELARRNGLTAVAEVDHLHLQLFPAGVLARAGVRFPQATGVRVNPLGPPGETV